MKMSFGIAPTELMAGAENAIDVCLGVQPGEHVALIADEVSRRCAVHDATAWRAERANVHRQSR